MPRTLDYPTTNLNPC